jgi:hypothetical protein
MADQTSDSKPARVKRDIANPASFGVTDAMRACYVHVATPKRANPKRRGFRPHGAFEGYTANHARKLDTYLALDMGAAASAPHAGDVEYDLAHEYITLEAKPQPAAKVDAPAADKA